MPCTSVTCVTRRVPSRSRVSWTTTSTAEAICSRMARSGRAMPAMSTRVSRRAMPSRGELAWTVDSEPSWPVFIAWSMSRLSPPRHSPTTIRSGRMRRELRTRSRIVIAPLPSMFGGRDSSRTTCSCCSWRSTAASLVAYTRSRLGSSSVRAAIYPRLSKDRTGLSPNTTIQEMECQDYAAEQGWDVFGIFPDNDISASRYSSKPRPGYTDLLHAIRTNRVEVVLCTEMSRLYRRIDELIDLIKLAEHTRLRRIETTDGYGYDLSTGEGIHNAISAVNNAQLESRKISDRSKRKKKAMARSGLFGGGRRPFGYDYISATRTNQGQVLEPGRLVLNKREAQAIKEAATRITGGSSVRSVALWLNDQGLLTTLGNRWTPFNLKRLLLSKTLLGIRTHRTLDPQTNQPVTHEYPGTWPAILDEVTHERLRIVLNDEAKLLGMDKRQ